MEFLTETRYLIGAVVSIFIAFCTFYKIWVHPVIKWRADIDKEVSLIK